MLLVYRIISNLLYPLLFIYLEFRKIEKKEDPDKYKQKILSSHFNVTKKGNSKLIWFHAASIGEFKSILPIINQLNIKDKKLKFLITTTTLSSGNLAKIELEKLDNVEHRYFPFDVNFLINKFLLEWKPDRIFLVDSEIWPNLILKAKELKIPISIINARITEKSYKKWIRFPQSAREIFNSFELCFAASQDAKFRLEKLGVKKIQYYGNIKFFNEIEINKIENLNKEILKQRPFWFAASTHPGEEEMCLRAHTLLKKKFKNILTIIAPRHIHRSKNIEKMSNNLKLNTQILNGQEMILDKKEVIILNSFGIMQNYFKYAKCVFIGKSTLKKLENIGGQNPLEAAKLNCKIYHGSFVNNFREIYSILDDLGISQIINDYNDLVKNLINDLNTSKEKEIKNSKILDDLGSKIFTNTIRDIQNLITNEYR